MNVDLITFETAELAKKCGFNEFVEWYYYPEAYQVDGSPIPIADGANDDINTTYYNGNNICNDNGAPAPLNLEDHNNNGVGFISAPERTLLQKWLREKYKIHVNPYMPNISGYYAHSLEHKAKYDSYEEALEAGLYEALILLTKLNL